MRRPTLRRLDDDRPLTPPERTTKTTTETYVTLKPTLDEHGTAGYAAVLRRDHGVCEWTGERIVDDLRHGPFCDAELVARGRAMDWAREIGHAYRD